jgi:hydrogenase maturation protease
MKKKILIVGIGNLLLTDEGVGVHVIRELSKKDLPEGVELADLGTATFELVRWTDGKDKVIIVDKLTPDDLKSGKRKLLTSLHQFGVVEALDSAAQTGNKPEVVIFGITPKDYQSPGTELTPELKGSIQKIVEAILQEIK